MSNDKNEIKTILELDLASYSDIARLLEENLDVYAVKAFEDQIKEFVDAGLEKVGLTSDEVVLGSSGDNVILVFDDAATMHQFATEVQKTISSFNREKTVASAKRWFRMGAATGPVLFIANERRIVGTTIARAVRLEAAASIGELFIDIPTYDLLPEDLQKQYSQEQEVRGKRNERFGARKRELLPPEERPDLPANVPAGSQTRQHASRLLWATLVVAVLLAGICWVWWSRAEVSNNSRVQNEMTTAVPQGSGNTEQASTLENTLPLGKWNNEALYTDGWDSVRIIEVTGDNESLQFSVTKLLDDTERQRIKTFKQIEFTGDSWKFDVVFEDGAKGSYDLTRVAKGRFEGELKVVGEQVYHHRMKKIE